MATLQRIRRRIIDKEYYLSGHAEHEMWADHLERPDVENVILKGRMMHVVCRFNEEGELMVITVYALAEEP